MRIKRLTPQGSWKHVFGIPILFCMLLGISGPHAALAQYPDKDPLPVSERTEAESNAASDCKALLRAVIAKDKAKVAALLKSTDPDCIYRGEGEPRSPLVAAAREGGLAIGKLLIDAGADVTFHARGDETPLMAAAANGRLDFVKYLVSSGAEVNKKLIGDGTALLVASRGGHAETVKYLLLQGAEVDAQVDADGTPLINAVRNDHYEVAKILLESGADPHLASPGDEYPMYHARMTENKPMIELLKQYEKDH